VRQMWSILSTPAYRNLIGFFLQRCGPLLLRNDAGLVIFKCLNANDVTILQIMLQRKSWFWFHNSSF